MDLPMYLFICLNYVKKTAANLRLLTHTNKCMYMCESLYANIKCPTCQHKLEIVYIFLEKRLQCFGDLAMNPAYKEVCATHFMIFW